MASGSRAKRKRKEKFQKTLILLCTGLILFLVALSAAITLGEEHGLPMPDWNEIQSWFGFRPIVPTLPQDAQDASTRIHFLDVGQGDSVLLEENGCFGLIDAGVPEAGPSIVQYLQQAGVKKLDFVLMTHPHADHIGGMKAVLESFAVDRMILPDFEKAPMATSKVFLDLLDTIERLGIPAETAQPGAEYPLGGGTLRVISTGVKTDNLNDISIVTMFETPELRFLASGDAERAVEKSVLDSGQKIRADLYKAGHHGSSTSNTKAFLEAVRPRVVVISCGKDNSYGHPNAAALEAFDSVLAQVYRTDHNGTVIAYVDQQGNLQIAVSKETNSMGAA